jgi:hypothetical protein
VYQIDIARALFHHVYQAHPNIATYTQTTSVRDPKHSATGRGRLKWFIPPGQIWIRVKQSQRGRIKEIHIETDGVGPTFLRAKARIVSFSLPNTFDK